MERRRQIGRPERSRDLLLLPGQSEHKGGWRLVLIFRFI
jgi:hypothetical protein